MQKNDKIPEYIVNIGLIASPTSLLAPASESGVNASKEGVPVAPIRTVTNTWVRIECGLIQQLGPEDQPHPDQVDSAVMFDAGGLLMTPGLIDAHTHPVFYGTRQAEFVRRNRGETYQQIAASGGGIISSLKGVRIASETELARLVRTRLDGFIVTGITTIEGKSGYGLSFDDEIKSLRALRTAAEHHPLEISPTLLAAHVVPPEFRHCPEEYVDLICDRLIPLVAEEQLAEAVDVFLETGAYNLDQSRRVFQAGRDAGLMLRIHADQFSASGGAELAAEFKAASADHMDQTDDRGYRRLAAAGVTVVLLPGAVFFLGLDRYAPARTIIEAGCNIALSTDFNPGSSPTQALPLMMTLGCIKMGLSPEEALWAVTRGAARALRRESRIGTIDVGYQADLCLWDAPDVAYLPYAYGNMIPQHVFKYGELVASKGCRL